MKAKTVRFGRVISKNYQSTKVEIEVELEKGDTAAQAMKAARIFVDRELGDVPTKEQVAWAKKTLEKAEQLELFGNINTAQTVKTTKGR